MVSSIAHTNSFICTQLNSSKYWCAIPIIQFLQFYMCTVKGLLVLLFKSNNSIQYYTFISTQLNGSKYCYVTLTI